MRKPLRYLNLSLSSAIAVSTTNRLRPSLISRNSDYERALELMYLGEFRESYNILSQYKDETASILAEYCKLRIAEGGAE